MHMSTRACFDGEPHSNPDFDDTNCGEGTTGVIRNDSYACASVGGGVGELEGVKMMNGGFSRPKPCHKHTRLL